MPESTEKMTNEGFLPRKPRTSRMRLRRRAIAAITGLAAAGLIAVIAGCGSAAGAPGSAGLEQTRLTVAVLPATDDAPFWLALKHGHFRQDGLTVTPQLVAQSTLSVPGLLHGGVDVIGGANYVSFFQVKARGALNIRVIAPAPPIEVRRFAVVARVSSGCRNGARRL